MTITINKNYTAKDGKYMVPFITPSILVSDNKFTFTLESIDSMCDLLKNNLKMIAVDEFTIKFSKNESPI